MTSELRVCLHDEHVGQLIEERGRACFHINADWWGRPGRAVLVYDQVSTVAWNEETMALPLFGNQAFSSVNRGSLLRLAEEVELAQDEVTSTIDGTLRRLHAAWPELTATAPYPKDHELRLRAHWKKRATRLGDVAALPT